jgi:septal ring factor EnvC (AmiA/AmiB activator)
MAQKEGTHMQDRNKTKAQLLSELVESRQRVAELEAENARLRLR